MSRSDRTLSLTVAALACAAALTGCARPEADTAPAPAPPPTTPAEAPPVAPTTPPAAPGDSVTPDDALGEAPDASPPPPDAPAPTDPSPAPAPAVLDEAPALGAMRLARTNAKIGVPVDLHYHFEGDVLSDHPVRLHLAAVPRVEGSNLEISVQQADGLHLSSGTLTVQKAAASGVYRKQLAVTRSVDGPTEIKVLVTMGTGSASGHGFYSIPLDSVKQH